MDVAYEAKLEQAANAIDSAFPSMLFEPLTNDFGDLYFKIDVEDYGQEAVRVDPRFTRKNIGRMRGSTKRIDRYLEWSALYDDYMAYISNKYGSLEMAMEMDEAGILKDPLPSFNHPPILRKGKSRRLLKLGIVPSFQPYGIKEDDCFEHLHRICDLEPEEHYDEEPDIQWALNHKPTKEEREFMQKSTSRYRRMNRKMILLSGSALTGISSNTNFIDNYYANVQRGMYDTEFTDSDKTGHSLASQMAKMEDEKYMHIGQRLARDDASGSARYVYDGAFIKDKEKMHDFEIMKHLQQYLGIDVLGTLASKGVSKSRIKAVRAGMVSVGADTGLSKKERKKLKKKQKKVLEHQNKVLKADQRLAEVLTNNKISVNGGTVRFEDLRRVRRHDDDDF